MQVGIERLAIHLRQPLGGAQHGHRLDRLVGRDINTIAVAPAAAAASATFDRPEHVGADALAPVSLQDRDMLEGRSVEHDVRLELREQAKDAVAVTDIGNMSADHCRGFLAASFFLHGVQRRSEFSITSSRDTPNATSRSQISEPMEPPPPVTIADFARDELLQLVVVDLHARPQQQVFHIHRRKPQRSSPSSSEGSRLAVNPMRRALVRIASGFASGDSAVGVGSVARC